MTKKHEKEELKMPYPKAGDLAIIVPPGAIGKVLVAVNKILTEDGRVLQEGEKMDDKNERLIDILDKFKKAEKGETDLIALAMEMFGVLVEPIRLPLMATEQAGIERITEVITKELGLLADTRLLERDQDLLLWIKIRELQWNEKASKERGSAEEAAAAESAPLRLEAAFSQGMAEAYRNAWRQILFAGCSVEDETLSPEVYEKAVEEWKEKAEILIGPKPGFGEVKEKESGGP